MSRARERAQNALGRARAAQAEALRMYDEACTAQVRANEAATRLRRFAGLPFMAQATETTATVLDAVLDAAELTCDAAAAATDSAAALHRYATQSVIAAMEDMGEVEP